jgi:hypothetical protein
VDIFALLGVAGVCGQSMPLTTAAVVDSFAEHARNDKTNS